MRVDISIDVTLTVSHYKRGSQRNTTDTNIFRFRFHITRKAH